MKTAIAHVRHVQAGAVPPVRAKIIPFPAGPRAARHPVLRRRAKPPGHALDISLALILAIACMMWEVVSMAPNALVEGGQSPVTSPRALLDVASARSLA